MIRKIFPFCLILSLIFAFGCKEKTLPEKNPLEVIPIPNETESPEEKEIPEEKGQVEVSKDQDPFLNSDEFSFIGELNPDWGEMTYLIKNSDTYLAKERSVCMRMHDLLNEEEQEKFSFADFQRSVNFRKKLIEILDNETSADNLIAELDELITSQVIPPGHDYAIMKINQFCPVGKNIYFILNNQDPSESIALYKDDKLKFFDTVDGGMKELFAPEVIGDKSIFGFATGEEYETMWRFYLLDPATMQGPEIENCNLDKTIPELTCEKEYKP